MPCDTCLKWSVPVIPYNVSSKHPTWAYLQKCVTTIPTSQATGGWMLYSGFVLHIMSGGFPFLIYFSFLFSPSAPRIDGKKGESRWGKSIKCWNLFLQVADWRSVAWADWSCRKVPQVSLRPFVSFPPPLSYCHKYFFLSLFGLLLFWCFFFDPFFPSPTPHTAPLSRFLHGNWYLRDFWDFATLASARVAGVALNRKNRLFVEGRIFLRICLVAPSQKRIASDADRRRAWKFYDEFLFAFTSRSLGKRARAKMEGGQT